MAVATSLLLVYAVILSLSPAVRLHTWEVQFRWQHWIGYTIWLVSFALLHRLLLIQLPEADPCLLPVAALLSGLGLLTIWRLDGNLGLRQTLWLAVGVTACWIMLRLPRVMHTLRRYKYLWLTGSLALTALTFIFGTFPGGGEPRLWLDFGGIYLQPSEPLKLMLVVFLAAYLADNLPVLKGLVQLILPSLVVFSGALGILVAQRDLGTATLLIVLYAALLYLATGKRRVLVFSAGLVVLAGLVGYQFFDVIRLRVDAWLNPWLDPGGKSFQIVQSLLAVAAGGVGGSGVGMGSPGLVPVVSSDFIFAAISEETGLLGSTAVILVFALLAGRGLLNGLKAPNLFQRMLSGGLVVFLVFQAMLIIGGNLRIFPLTGVTLPFVSYGGSSLLTSFISLSLLLLVSSQSEEESTDLPGSQPILTTGAALLSGLLLIALANGYWAVIRGPALLQRADNPRWTIAERFVLRGALLDRNNQAIVQTTGQPGAYTRQVLHPDLGAVVGYTHPIYGKAGLELYLDAYLRGELGNPSSTIVTANLLYAQPPPGVNVRLSIDLRMQSLADSLLQGKRGALVLLNARSGEILVMASHPTFDPNQLDQNWTEWMGDESGIFVNRSTQGQYPLGGALGPFLLTEVMDQGYLPPVFFDQQINFDQYVWSCAFNLTDVASWGSAVQNGCPGALLTLSQQLSTTQLVQLYHRLGLTETPVLPLPVSAAGTIADNIDRLQLSLGQTELLVSPLQTALAAAMISSGGARPAAHIAIAMQTPLQGWVVLGSNTTRPNDVLTSASAAAQQLKSTDLPIWESTSTALTEDGPIYWYVAGTLPEWQGAPLALALVLEDGSPSEALTIGNDVLRSILLP